MITSKQSLPLKTGTVLTGVLAAGACGVFAQNPPAAATPPVEEKKPFWETTAALGLTLTRGNSETLLLNGSILTQHKDLKNEISLGIDGGYGETKNQDTGDTDVNTKYLHGFGQYNRLFTDRFYAYGRIDGLSDDIADIDYRFSFSPGVGYYIVKTEKIRLSAEVGPGLITEKKGSVESTYFTIRLGEKFEWKISERARLWQSLEYLPKVDDFGNYIVNAELGIEASLTKKLSLRSYVQDTYISEPAPGRDENDLKWITGLAYKF
jgi:putative salt-induced outer membrane protein YdiY